MFWNEKKCVTVYKKKTRNLLFLSRNNLSLEYIKAAVKTGPFCAITRCCSHQNSLKSRPRRKLTSLLLQFQRPPLEFWIQGTKINRLSIYLSVLFSESPNSEGGSLNLSTLMMCWRFWQKRTMYLFFVFLDLRFCKVFLNFSLSNESKIQRLIQKGIFSIVRFF